MATLIAQRIEMRNERTSDIQMHMGLNGFVILNKITVNDIFCLKKESVRLNGRPPHIFTSPHLALFAKGLDTTALKKNTPLKQYCVPALYFIFILHFT